MATYTALKQKDSFMRYEKKFKISISEYPLLKIHLKKLHFKKIYESRFISSIYYDTSNFDLYNDSINGISNRKKIRVRFYNDDYSQVNIEEKIKISDLGFKKIYPLSQNKDLKRIKLKIKNNNFNNDLVIPEKIDNFYLPVSFINYYRTYFISYDMKTRITLDENITYSKIIKMHNYLFLNSKIPESLGVFEIKYEKINEDLINPILHLSSSLNFHLSRNSKYCNSIESLY